ncbi:phosphotransferase [Haloactinomyces albus]|uniref:Aminoglycoside phosphotransferase (APT) family kinase protein n=1 Tax=Haloactinomyces albus TaxID=1352928 RepID=A0AAE3ZGW0_9ACTN|nr:phosphotransferase [Haloactinomyces albus]MDR7302729.1 aminoglycoside phosphotransferase (APT) family kinase protein [Haloactinomyces albus]
MRTQEVHGIAAALGSHVMATRTLAGGFSHETCLLTLTDGQVVVRLGDADPAIEGTVMDMARRYVPVPQVLLTVPATDERTRPAMVLEHVAGTPLSRVLSEGEHSGTDLAELGAEVGRVVAGIGAATFDRRGFFADEALTIPAERPWSRQLPEIAVNCMAATPRARLDRATRAAWVDLCTTHAPSLVDIDHHTRLVHSDINPKNILVARTCSGWRVNALLDWEFSYSGCPYADAANMVRFGVDYPACFLDGFRAAFADQQPADLPLLEQWAYLGRVLDMFALSDLVTRPVGHPIAEQAAQQIRGWVTAGVPDSG